MGYISDPNVIRVEPSGAVADELNAHKAETVSKIEKGQEVYSNLSASTQTITVTFANPFISIPNVQATKSNLTGDLRQSVQVYGESKTGFTIQISNTSGTTVGGKVNWFASL